MSRSRAQRITEIVDVGAPPENYSLAEYQSFEVHFHRFEDLPATDEPVVSPGFSCFGHQWRLELYPFTQEESSIGLYLSLQTKRPCSIGVIYHLIIKESDGDQVANFFGGGATFVTYGGVNRRKGTKDFVKRSEVLDVLGRSAGTMIAEVRLKLDSSEPYLPFIPENPVCKNILKRFNDEETADALFDVVGESEQGRGIYDEDGGAKKKARREAVYFYAHRSILQDSATTLSELAKSADGMTPIQITNVKPEIFGHLLYYVYGGEVPEEEMKENAKDLIDAADKYGVVGLKLQAEAHYARTLKGNEDESRLSVDNVLDNLLYADSKNCAYLKEVVVDFIAENGKEVLDEVSFDDVPGSVVTDLLTATTRREQEKETESNVDENGDDFTTMRVSALRKKLHEKGLDIDGSREAMIALLEEDTQSVEDEENDAESAEENP